MKEGVLKYLKNAKIIYTVINVILIILLGFAFVILTQFYRYLGILILLASALVIELALLIAAHIYYNSKIAMGAVFEIVINKSTITLRTAKKDFTYDLTEGCKSVQDKGNRYVCLFADASDADTFIFYKRAPLTKNPATQFSEEEIKLFYPLIDEVKIK